MTEEKTEYEKGFEEVRKILEKYDNSNLLESLLEMRRQDYLKEDEEYRKNAHNKFRKNKNIK